MHVETVVLDGHYGVSKIRCYVAKGNVHPVLGVEAGYLLAAHIEKPAGERYGRRRQRRKKDI
jgi:hypothetical protein